MSSSPLDLIRAAALEQARARLLTEMEARDGVDYLAVYRQGLDDDEEQEEEK